MHTTKPTDWANGSDDIAYDQLVASCLQHLQQQPHCLFYAHQLPAQPLKPHVIGSSCCRQFGQCAWSVIMLQTDHAFGVNNHLPHNSSFCTLAFEVEPLFADSPMRHLPGESDGLYSAVVSNIHTTTTTFSSVIKVRPSLSLIPQSKAYNHP